MMQGEENMRTKKKWTTSNNIFINFLTSYPGLPFVVGQILFPEVKSIVTFSLSKLSGAFTEKPPP